jgi:hypothetical protein
MQRSTNIIHKTKDRVKRTPLKTGGDLMCSVNVELVCSVNVELMCSINVELMCSINVELMCSVNVELMCSVNVELMCSINVELMCSVNVELMCSINVHVVQSLIFCVEYCRTVFVLFLMYIVRVLSVLIHGTDYPPSVSSNFSFYCNWNSFINNSHRLISMKLLVLNIYLTLLDGNKQ